jgi:predicted nuclease of predicted toxin-antitoxin system
VRFLADEGVDRQIVERLRAAGHDVSYVAEMSPGIMDDVVLNESRGSDRVLITADKDFGELVFRQRKAYAGVLLVRLAGFHPDRKAEIVDACVRAHGPELHGAFSVLSPGNLRIRRAGSN